ncbi:hypothetical protein [Solitalea koreensis]|nr:hypothetical protein [Solitalea koreensis]
MNKKTSISIALHCLSLFLLVLLCYFTQRTDAFQLISLFSALAGVYLLILRKYSSDDFYRINLSAAVLFRIAVIFALPNLTDDFYRYVWDGRLLHYGFNPFDHRPGSYLDIHYPGLSPELYAKLSSPYLYSVYPPFCQSIYGIACNLFPENLYNSVLVMKAFILAFELGTIGMLSALLRYFKLNKNLLFIYALNPVVIVEFCGNLHFEAGMIFFSLLVTYLLLINRTLTAGICMAFAVCLKLIPALFIPLFLKPFGFRKTFDLVLVGLLFGIFFSLPFVYKIEQIEHIFQTIQLYFQQYEFNASFYYLIRWVGFKFTHVNELLIIGKWLAVTLGSTVFYFTFFTSKAQHKLPGRMMWLLLVYFLLATTVQPWYILPLIALCIFTNYRFAVIWSLLIPLTYLNYPNENLWLVTFEYVVVIGFMTYELISKKQIILPITPLIAEEIKDISPELEVI